MTKRAIAGCCALLIGLVLVGCASSQEGVKTDMTTQWTDVAANTKDATNAAKTVLEAHGLKDVTSSFTSVDGVASGKMANGSKIAVTIKKNSDNISEVSVKVGVKGNQSLGASLAKQIKDKAEAK